MTHSEICNFEIGNRIRDKAAKLIYHFQGKYLLIFLQLVFKFGFNHRSESLIRLTQKFAICPLHQRWVLEGLSD